MGEGKSLLRWRLCKPAGKGGVRKIQDVFGEDYSARMERGAAESSASWQESFVENLPK